MRRRILLFFLLALALTVSVHAAGTVRLEDLGMSVSIPEGYTVVTRNMAPDDPALEIFDMDSDQVTKLLEDGNIYLDLMNEDPDFEYSVTSVPNEVKTIARFDDDTLKIMEDQLKEQYLSADVNVKEVEHLFNGEAMFFRILVSGEQGDEQVQLLRYYTVHDYHAIYLTLQYWGSEIPEKYQELAQDILYSVRFDEPDIYSAPEDAQTDESSDDSKTQTASGPIEQMLAPKPAAEDVVQTPAPAPVAKKSFPVIPVILAVAAVAAAAAAAAVCVDRARKKRAGQQDDAGPAARRTSAKRVCAACGTALPAGAKRCPRCGKKTK